MGANNCSQEERFQLVEECRNPVYPMRNGISEITLSRRRFIIGRQSTAGLIQ